MNNPHQQLTMDELTERFYAVKEQRDKLMWCLGRIMDMASDELRRRNHRSDTNMFQIETDGRTVLDEVRDNLASLGASARKPITVNWLHTIAPSGWETQRRGIAYANWSIHTVVQNGNYDDGPFVWSVLPSHSAMMRPLDRPDACAVLVMECRLDVIRLLHILRRQSRDDQSYRDLAASGGIVDAP